MWPMKHADFIKQNHRNSATCSFADIGTQLIQERLNVTPLNVGTHGSRMDSF
jgi:hypothetical protein